MHHFTEALLESALLHWSRLILCVGGVVDVVTIGVEVRHGGSQDFLMCADGTIFDAVRFLSRHS